MSAPDEGLTNEKIEQIYLKMQQAGTPTTRCTICGQPVFSHTGEDGPCIDCLLATQPPYTEEELTNYKESWHVNRPEVFRPPKP